MAQIGTETNPLRVAIVGSGPAGFYAVERLFHEERLSVEVDMFDELATPFGLVRAGVAPDHQKIKSVIRVYDRNARKPNYRFYGNLRYGRDIHLGDLKRYYHQICFTTGAPTDRSLGIPGEDLASSHAATEFVAWYNGHPDFRDRQFDLSGEAAAVIGVGNVAIDVARILCRTHEELAATDIADYALDALRQSRIKTVYLIGRRGPAQAAFTNPEIKEMGELQDADAEILPAEAALDTVSQVHMDNHPDKAVTRKIEILQNYAGREPTGKSRRLIIRFLLSPTELIGDEHGQVKAVHVVKNELYADESGNPRPRATEHFETLPANIVFRSVGYRGMPLPDLPFNESWGVILNDKGRILTQDKGEPLAGMYASGWIKRGPTGVIGTNKPDAAETVECMLEDLAKDRTLNPTHPEVTQVEQFIKERQPDYVTYSDWLKLDQMEIALGQERGRPRVKFTRTADMLAALRGEMG